MSFASLLWHINCWNLHSFRFLPLSFHTRLVRGQDFSADDPLQITFIPGVNESCAMVSIIDDNALEGDHEFTVSIGMTVPPITIDNTPIEFMIEDNEGIFFYNRRQIVQRPLFFFFQTRVMLIGVF